MMLRNPLGVLIAPLYQTVQKYVAAGFQQDSLRRFINRQGISTAGMNLSGLWQEAVFEKSVSDQIVGKSSLLRPRVGRDMVPRLLKVPFRHQYVVQIQFRDNATGQFRSTALSVFENAELTKGEAQRRAMAVFDERVGFEEKYRASQNSKALGGELLNAYYNVGWET